MASGGSHLVPKYDLFCVPEAALDEGKLHGWFTERMQIGAKVWAPTTKY